MSSCSMVGVYQRGTHCLHHSDYICSWFRIKNVHSWLLTFNLTIQTLIADSVSINDLRSRVFTFYLALTSSGRSVPVTHSNSLAILRCTTSAADWHSLKFSLYNSALLFQPRALSLFPCNSTICYLRTRHTHQNTWQERSLAYVDGYRRSIHTTTRGANWRLTLQRSTDLRRDRHIAEGRRQAGMCGGGDRKCQLYTQLRPPTPNTPLPSLPKAYIESKGGTRDSLSNPVLLNNNLCFCKRKSTLFVLSSRARIFKHGFSAIFLIHSRRTACRHLPCMPQVYLIIHDSNFHCVTNNDRISSYHGGDSGDVYSRYRRFGRY